MRYSRKKFSWAPYALPQVPFVLSEDRGVRVCFCHDVMSVVATRTDRDLGMSQVELASVETLRKAVHDVFLEMIFLYDFFIAVAFPAGFNLVFAADFCIGVCSLDDIVWRSVTVNAEGAVCK